MTSNLAVYLGFTRQKCTYIFIWILIAALCITSPNQKGLPQWLSSKESACNAGDTGLIPGEERSPEEGNSNPLQYSCLENPMDRGASWPMVHGVAKSGTAEHSTAA